MQSDNLHQPGLLTCNGMFTVLIEHYRPGTWEGTVHIETSLSSCGNPLYNQCSQQADTTKLTVTYHDSRIGLDRARASMHKVASPLSFMNNWNGRRRWQHAKCARLGMGHQPAFQPLKPVRKLQAHAPHSIHTLPLTVTALVLR
jgi:hypothetical protein